jgi:sporulation protein YtfJ
MPENKMSEIIRASVESIKGFAENDTFMGRAINTPSGVTVIPVSKISMGIATGGVDYSQKKLTLPANFGGGGGTGLSITPIAFLTVSPNSEVNLITLEDRGSDIEKITGLIDRSPDIIEKIKSVLS